MRKKFRRDPDSGTGGGEQLPAHRAAATGNVSLLVKVIQRDPGLLEQRDRDGFTPLAHAVQAQNLAAVKRLVKMGASINAQDTEGRTYLSAAAYQGWNEGVVYLLRKGANQNICDKSGRTPLHASTYDSDTRTLMSLLQQLTLKEVNETDNEKMTVLHWASFHGRPEHVRQLLLRGVEPACPDMDGKTPLHWAAQNGCRSCCLLLVNCQPSSRLCRFQDNTGKTAVHLAAAAGHWQIVQDLARLDPGVCVIEDQDDRTPLHWAAAMGHASCIRVLLQLGASPNPVDMDGGTPLEYATQANHTECSRLLEERLGLRGTVLQKSTDGVPRSSGKHMNIKTPIGFLKGLFRGKEGNALDKEKQGPRDICQESLVNCEGTAQLDKMLSPNTGSPTRIQKKAQRTNSKSLSQPASLDGDITSVETESTSALERAGASRESEPAQVGDVLLDKDQDSGRRKKHHKHKKKKMRHVNLDGKPSSPASWMALESHRETAEVGDEVREEEEMNTRLKNRHGANPRRVHHHLSPLQGRRLVSPSAGGGLTDDPLDLVLKRRQELNPLLRPAERMKASAGGPLSPGHREVRSSEHGSPESPIPLQYSTTSVNTRRTLPEISPASHVTTPRDGSSSDQRKHKKHAKHKKRGETTASFQNQSILNVDDNQTLSTSPVPLIRTHMRHSSPALNTNNTEPLPGHSGHGPEPRGDLYVSSPHRLTRHPSDDAISLYKLSIINKKQATASVELCGRLYKK